jgi:2,3-dihydroxybiphenyl 1,2-dioxygenase
MTILNTNGFGAITQLGYIGIGVSDIAAWRDFAGEVLGLQINGEAADGSLFLRMDNYHHRFELIPGGADDIAFHGWEVKDAASLEQVANQIRAYGLEVTRGDADEIARRRVIDLIKFNDPDGLATEIYYGAGIDHTPFRSPRGVRGFVADALGLGHIVLAVADAPEYIRFYTEVLGARMSDIIYMTRGEAKFSGTFLHVNPRHHSLAIAQRPPAAPVKRLEHFMIEVNNLDDVGRARALCQARGIAVGGFGRHTNDKMFSFYCRAPSGFRIEYGFDGMQIEDETKWEVTHHTAPSVWGHEAVPR